MVISHYGQGEGNFPLWDFCGDGDFSFWSGGGAFLEEVICFSFSGGGRITLIGGE